MAHQDPQPHDPAPDAREARLQRILRQIEQQLRAALPDPDQPLERIEQEVVEIGRTLREIIERETLAATGTGSVGSQRLQLGRGEQSVGVRALAARFISYLSERKAAVELELVTGIRLSPRSLQRAGVAVGAALAAAWAEQERQLFAHQGAPPARRPWQLHVGMDGVFVLVGRDWREAKVGEVYERGADGGMARIACSR